MSKIKEDDIPKSIQIENYNYNFKQKKANNFYAYRCKHRKCGVLISIDENNLLKIINKKPNETIEYEKTSKKDHDCDANNAKVSSDNVFTTNQQKKNCI